jgi:hypothetical protein
MSQDRFQAEVMDEQKMMDLSEESLTDAIKKIQSMVDKNGKAINMKPTTIMYQPAMLDELGITHDDLVRMLGG